MSRPRDRGSGGESGRGEREVPSPPKELPKSSPESSPKSSQRVRGRNIKSVDTLK